MKKTIVPIIIILLLIVAALFLGINKDAVAPTVENIATTTDGEVGSKAVSNGGVGGEIENNTISKTATTTPTKPKEPPKPRSVTTPYSVYLGFATEAGTSSEALMTKEANQVVVGYEWEALLGSQMFSSLIMPQFDESAYGDNKEYTISVLDEKKGEFIVLGKYSPGEKIDFPREGLVGTFMFKLTGIDPDLLICPGDRGTNWRFRFTFNGQLGLIKTPITETLPVGEKCKFN